MKDYRNKENTESMESSIKEKCIKIIALVDDLNSWLSGAELGGKVKLSR